MAKYRLLRAFCFTLMLALCCQANLWSGNNCGSPTGNTVVDHARQLSTPEFMKYIEELGKKEDLDALMAIAKSDVPKAEMGMTKLCEILESDKAISLCSRLDAGSVLWRSAMHGLASQPRGKVVGYMRQMVTSRIPEARWACYQECLRNGWDDLLDQASHDALSTEKLTIPGGIDATIGDTASHYLKVLRKHQSK